MQATMASRNETATSSSDAIMVDPISNLPESLITYILSSLPTKDAVATSILSRSWRFRWTTVTSFDFDNTSERSNSPDAVQTMDFSEFINMVLLKHSGESINMFVLVWEWTSFRPVYLHLWTSIAISRNVRVLDLETESTEHCEFHLPSSLYTCGTLEELSLEEPFRVKPPNVVYESFHKLISCCLILKSLALVRTNERDNLVVCSITSPLLEHLLIDFQDGPGAPSGGGGLQLKIDAPALISLYLFDSFSSHISIQSRLASLVEGALSAPFLTDNMIVDLLHAIVSVQNMTLAEKVIKALEKATLPVFFKSLARLSINSHGLPRWSSLMHLLDGCVELKKLEIRCHESSGDPWRNPARAPSCLSSSLRHLTLTRFDGLKKEMAMLKFFLNHGLVMERVYLSCDWLEATINHAKRLKIFKKVSKLSRASPTCKIYWHEILGAAVEWES